MAASPSYYLDLSCPQVITPTPTPTACNCEYYDVEITSEDISNATGNTGINLYRNGVVFVTYRPCSGGLETLQYTGSSYYGNAFCQDTAFGITIDVWQNDFQISYTSTATPTGICCEIIPTPTPTITPTETPTPTPTPTPTETPINYSYYAATRFLNCEQDSAPGAYTIKVPTSFSGTWFTNGDGYEYQFANVISPDPPSYYAEMTAYSNACGGTYYT